MSEDKKKLFDHILYLLSKPGGWQWSFTGYTYDHIETGISIWMGNGFPFCGLYRPRIVHFGLIRAFRLSRAVKRHNTATVWEELRERFGGVL